MVSAKLLSVTGACVVVVMVGMSTWMQDGEANGLSVDELTVANYCEGIVGTDMEDECGLCQTMLDTGATLETGLYCPDEDEVAFTLGDLLSMDLDASSSFRDLCTTPSDRRLQHVAAVVGTDGPHARMARKLANVSPAKQSRKLLNTNYGWCSMDISFLTGGADTANFCAQAKPGGGATGAVGNPTSNCCEQHDNCLQCSDTTYCGSPDCKNNNCDKGDCDAALSSCAARQIGLHCSGCSGCGWRGCSGCSSCDPGQGAAAACISAAMAFKPNGGQTC